MSSDGKQITALSNGGTVLTLLLNGAENGNDVTASLTLDLNYPLDQSQIGDFIALPLVIEGLDLDLSSLGSSNVTLVIRDGQAPVLSDTTSITVNEADLLQGRQLSFYLKRH
ncbi:hypothetical protein [Vibrio parahaemolyticus]|uniref:hypothetical protein n=1 Tax=Vibrio parahaemolyticus TaxID=670 RepID=UPI002360C1FF|nr:hypothetical protein [Vibrio parahaemolyticus]